MKKLILPAICFFLACACNNGHILDFDSSIEYSIPQGIHPAVSDEDILLINNDRELKYAFPNNYSLLKPIDFHSYRVLILKGLSTYGIESIDHQLHDKNLAVNITQTIAAVIEPWTVAYLIPRHINPTDIKISIHYNNDQANNLDE